MAQFGQLPEVVKFIEFGKEHLAFPVASRDLEHHLGENDEPLLTLLFVKPVGLDECVRCHFAERNHGVPYSPQAVHQPCAKFEAPAPKSVTDAKELVQVVADIPHVSHKFTDIQLEALKQQNISVEIAYPGKNIPGGRWRELTGEELDEYAEQAHERERKALFAQREREAATEQQKASEAPAPEPQAPVDEIEKEARIRHRLKQLEKESEQPKENPAPKAPESPSGNSIQ